MCYVCGLKCEHLHILRGYFAQFCMNTESAHVSGVSHRLKRTDSASFTACGTQLELWLFKVNRETKHVVFHQSKWRGASLCLMECLISVVLVLPGAGPHPKALSGRIICCSWWFFTVVLLACYFSNLSSSKTPESAQLMVKGFEDLANQDTIEYGCLAGSSTLAFFKVRRKMFTQLLRLDLTTCALDN